MGKQRRIFVLIHIAVLAAALAFLCYALTVEKRFPNGFLHCVLHDIFRFYCPFCGGTRAMRAVAELQLRQALLLCPTVMAAGLLLLAADLRALVLLFIKKEDRRLFPRLLGQAVLAVLLFGTVLRNCLLLCGVDTAGELLTFWQPRLTPFLRAAGILLWLLIGVLLWLAIDEGRRPRPVFARLAALFGAAAAGILLVALLYRIWWFGLGLVPVAALGGWVTWRSAKKDG